MQRERMTERCYDPIDKLEWVQFARNDIEDREQVALMLERMAEYEDAEDQGRLLILPCKIGTKIYEANKHTGKVFQRIASKEDMLTKITPGWGTRYFATPEEADRALTE